jgi:monoamine oxidase
VIATSNQDNSLNQDLNGIGAGFTDSTASFASLGIVTNPISASGQATFTAVPEPSTWLGAATLLGLAASSRSRRKA